MQKLKSIGLKLTPQRIAIFKYLEGNILHPSAEEIYKEVKKKFPTISYATVYNTLDILRRRGIVMELTIDPDRKRYDPNTEPHHHLICVICKKIVDINTNFNVEIPEEQKRGFTVIKNQIEFYGICPECKKKGKDKDIDIVYRIQSKERRCKNE